MKGSFNSAGRLAKIGRSGGRYCSRWAYDEMGDGGAGRRRPDVGRQVSKWASGQGSPNSLHCRPVADETGAEAALSIPSIDELDSKNVEGYSSFLPRRDNSKLSA